MDTLDAIRERAAAGMRGYLDHEGQERTDATKQAAEALVEAREHFYTRDGDPDLLGRSHDYRQWVKGALDDANVPDALRPTLQSAIRFHISPIMRRRHPEEVKELGLKEGSTIQRGSLRRQRDAKTLGLFRGGPPITDLDQAILVARLGKLGVARVADVTGTAAELAELAQAFTHLADAAREAAKRVGG